MASTYSSRWRLELMADGEQDSTWGGKTNTNLSLLDEGAMGFLSKSVAGAADVTLTANNGSSDESRQFCIECTGTLTGSINVIVPTAEGRWIIHNNTAGAFTLTVKTSGGTGIAVTQGEKAALYCDGTNVLKVFATDDWMKTGKQTVWVPASGMYTRTTNGAASGSVESTTNKVMMKTWDFDKDTNEFVQFNIGMPKSWNESTVTFIPYWTAASGSGDVIWGLQGISLSNSDVIDTAFGTAQTSTDILLTALDIHIGPTSSAITIGGTPAENDWVVFQVYRDANAGGDTLGVDGLLIGIKLLLTYDVGDDS